MGELGEQKRAVIYTRVSSKEQVDGSSLDTQERYCREYADRYGFLVDKVFVERGESAKTANRTELQSMLHYVGVNFRHLSAVIVYKVDRWARSTKDHGDLRAIINHLGLRLLSATENLEDTPVGHFVENELANFAQFDNEIRGERCKNGMIDAVNAGKYVWQAPLGYVNGRAKCEPSLQPASPSIVALVRKSFELVDSGYSVTEALQRVTNEGLRARTGRELSRNTFRTMLMNKRYIGLIEGFGKMVRGDFEPLVSEDVFYRIQPKLHRAPLPMRVVYRKDNPEFPLRGVLLCPRCGHRLTASESKGNGGKYGYYSCPSCGKFRARKEGLERHFVEALAGLSLQRDYARLLEIAIDTNLERQRSWMKHETISVQQQISDLKAREMKIVEKTLSDVIPEDRAKELLAIAATQEEELREKLALVSQSALATPDVVKTGLNILTDMRSFWAESDLTTKQQFQGFVFPKGIAIEDSRFGTSETAACLKLRQLPANPGNIVVGPPGFEPRTKWL